MYSVFYIPGGCLGFLPSTVSSNVIQIPWKVPVDLSYERKTQGHHPCVCDRLVSVRCSKVSVACQGREIPRNTIVANLLEANVVRWLKKRRGKKNKNPSLIILAAHGQGYRLTEPFPIWRVATLLPSSSSSSQIFEVWLVGLLDMFIERFLRVWNNMFFYCKKNNLLLDLQYKWILGSSFGHGLKSKKCKTRSPSINAEPTHIELLGRLSHPVDVGIFA